MKALENTVAKGETTGNQHFLLFPTVFSTLSHKFVNLATFNLLSANAFNLVMSKTLSFGKRLMQQNIGYPDECAVFIFLCKEGVVFRPDVKCLIYNRRNVGSSPTSNVGEIRGELPCSVKV